jgi:hypothetical protein
MPKEKMSDVVVLLPGITGSVLSRGGDVIWGLSAKAGLRALFSRGGVVINALKLGDDSDPERETLDDGVTADALINDLHLIPGLWKIDGYGKIKDNILRDFEVTEGRNYFELPYDWRRDNRAAAWKLKRRAHEWLARWRQSSGNGDAKLILVAHSMGGLVSRYFLECLEGWKDTRALITYGTPYRGSLNAVNTLANGEKHGPFGVLDITPLTDSLTSIYQLMPVYPVYDAGGGDLLRIGETKGIPGINPDRATAALAFHHEIRNKVKENDDEHGRERYRIFPIVGTHQPTNQSARIVGGRVVVEQIYKGEDMSGDGTVPRVSATPIEFKGDSMYAATRHGSLQNDDATLTQLSGIFTGLYIDLGDFMGRGDTAPGKAHLSLDVEDLYWEGEPVNVRVRADRHVEGLRAALVNADTGAEVASRTLAGESDGWQQGEFGGVGAGFYRIVVAGGDSVAPVADIFEVVGAKTLE